MVSTLDLSQPGNLHPTNKREFGERLARLVLAREYGKGANAECAEYSSHEVAAGAIRLWFEHTASGLTARDGKQPTGFEIAGADRIFVPATGRVENGAIVVSSDRVPKPVAARYAWAANPDANIMNAAGLPLAPFRTDDWPVEGEQLLFRELSRKGHLEVTRTAAAITTGTAPEWHWAGEGVASPAVVPTQLLRTFDTTQVQLLIFDHPGNVRFEGSPSLAWASDTADGFGALHPGQGCTVEVRLQIYQASDPFRGFDIEANLPQAKGPSRTYRISVTPMGLCGIQGRETRVLGSNLDNNSRYHNYRVAIRPDGVAQVYFDDQPMGVLSGVPASGPISSPRLTVGKLIPSGDLVANLESVSMDLGGAYAP